MAAKFDEVFALLKPVLGKFAKRLFVKKDTAREYTLVTKRASPHPQHKGERLYFGSVRLGKAYVSFHLMPLYMCPEMDKAITPALKQRMQGKTCFNFKSDPGPELLADLQTLTAASFNDWRERKWL
jgi:hypothetical protein